MGVAIHRVEMEQVKPVSDFKSDRVFCLDLTATQTATLCSSGAMPRPLGKAVEKQPWK
jgi:hypothetical protein